MSTGFFVKEIISAYIVQPGDMILMRVGKNNGIELPYLCPKHLVAEIRSRIDHQGGRCRLDKDAGAKAIVFFIFGCTYFATAGNHGHATAGAGAEKGDL